MWGEVFTQLYLWEMFAMATAGLRLEIVSLLDK